MAVIISDSATNLSTVNGFLRCEAYNLGCSSATNLALNTPRMINVTFANAGNCQGIIIAIQAQATTNTSWRAVTARLQQALGTATVTIASPGVITKVGHGLNAGDQFTFSTTGATPTGLTAGTIYFVSATGLTADTFQFSTTSGGASVNTSGSQSGTHTLWADRATKTLTGAEISNSVARPFGTWIVPFEFATPFAVDTTASKWRFHVANDTTGTNNWFITTSDGTNPFYVTWCDTTRTFANGDIVIVKEAVTIDQAGTVTGLIANNTGDSANAVAMVICKSADGTVANVGNLKWASAPASSYSLTINGVVYMGAHSGVRAGASGSRISYANKGVIDFASVSNGTLMGFKAVALTNGTTPKASIIVYGEIPSVRYTTLASDAATGQPNITTVDATGWAIGDTVYIGKQDVTGQGDINSRTISSIAGTAITLSSNILTNLRKAGGIVMRMNGYGFQIKGPTALATSLTAMSGMSNFVLSGVQVTDHIFNVATSSTNNNYDDAGNRSRHTVQDGSVESTSTSITRFSNQVMLVHDGITFERLVLWRVGLYGTLNQGTIVGTLGPGSVTVNNLRVLSPGAGTGTDTSSKIVAYDFDDIVFENSGTNGMMTINGAKNTTADDISFWGCSSSISNNVGALTLGTTINARFNNIKYNRCTLALLFAGVPQRGIVDIDSVFGDEAANTTDVDFLAGAFTDYEMRSPTGAVNVATANLTSTIDGTQLRIPEYNDTPNDDRVWLTYGRFRRTGPGLSDTTARTAGGYALVFEPVDDGLGTNLLRRTEVIPTGDIQNKTMTISVWVKVNLTGYDAGTHSMPTLTVDYDNGTLITAVAQAEFGSFQQLSVTFTPQTTYGQVTATLSGATDASGADAYFYEDDWNVAYPAGVSIDLGGLDLWAGGLPVGPPIATFPSLGGVWDEALSAHNIPGSFGDKIKRTRNNRV